MDNTNIASYPHTIFTDQVRLMHKLAYRRASQGTILRMYRILRSSCQMNGLEATANSFRNPLFFNGLDLNEVKYILELASSLIEFNPLVKSDPIRYLQFLMSSLYIQERPPISNAGGILFGIFEKDMCILDDDVNHPSSSFKFLGLRYNLYIVDNRTKVFLNKEEYRTFKEYSNALIKPYHIITRIAEWFGSWRYTVVR